MPEDPTRPAAQASDTAGTAVSPEASIAAASANGGVALAGRLTALVAAGGAGLTPAAVSAIQQSAMGALLKELGGLMPADGAAAFAPTSRLLTQAVERMAGPNAPDPALVAVKVLANSPGTMDHGMLADGPAGLLPEAARKVLA